MTRKICPVCNGQGKIIDPKRTSNLYTSRYMECPNCQGEGFVGIPDNLKVRKPLYEAKEELK